MVKRDGSGMKTFTSIANGRIKDPYCIIRHKARWLCIVVEYAIKTNIVYVKYKLKFVYLQYATM
jgi:hypothetical protein